MIKIVIKNRENKNVISEIVKMFSVSKIFLFNGKLGAGKTTLIKDIAKFLGIKEPIVSPTFILWQKYCFIFKNKKMFFNHLDLYRIRVNDLKKINFFSELLNCKNYFFIEWGFKLKRFLKINKIKFIEIFIIKKKKQRVFIIK